MGNCDVVVVMVPFPAHGHLNPPLHLSRLVSSYDIPVYYLGLDSYVSQAKARIHGWDPLTTPNIHFKEFPTPSSYSTSISRKTLSEVVVSAFDASLELREPVTQFLFELGSYRRVVVIYDSLMTWVVQDVVSIPNAEAYCFCPLAAFVKSSMYFENIQKRLHLPTFLGKIVGRLLLPSGAEFFQGLPSLDSCFSPEFMDFAKKQYDIKRFCSGDLHNTCKVIEGPYLKILAKFNNLLRRANNQWAIGPLYPTSLPETHKDYNRHKCLKWLDEQEANSVLLVSFGTTTTFSTEQMKELATGLENCQQKFIWIASDTLLPEDEQVQIPKDYEERVQGRGIVVKDWAPQMEILGHSSTGGFLSHCGWNSCLESITGGVPLATWPMYFDHPRTAVLVTQVLKIGITVKEWEKRDELISSTTIETAIRKLMASNEGNEMRMRASELAIKVRQSVSNGGDSKKEMDSFIAHITRS